MNPAAGRALAKEAGRLLPDLVRVRRAIHRHPELGFEERKTQAFLLAELKRRRIRARKSAGTGILATLGPSRGPAVLLRADMDALPITERSGVAFPSKVPGVMHACGHDAHMAMLLGAGTLLKARERELPAQVKLVFQPAEEAHPGGALGLIEDGVLRKPEVGAAFALHVDYTLPSGTFGVRPGPFMAAADEFDLAILGEGGHGARPHSAVDAIVAAAAAIQALQTVVSRRVDPVEPAVVTIGTIKGGYRHNVIADRVEMTGTVRTLSSKLRQEIPGMIEETVHGIVAAHRAGFEFEYRFGYPVLVNDAGRVDFVEGVGRTVVGARRMVRMKDPAMGAEDFAYFLEKAPGAMIRLGIRNEKEGAVHPIHSPRFRLDESALPSGAALLAALALESVAESARR